MLYCCKKKVPIFEKQPVIRSIGFSNNTALVQLDWTESFILNGDILGYDLIINNNSLHIGKNSSFFYAANLSDCENTNYGYFTVDVQLLLVTESHTVKSPKMQMKVNCSSKVYN